MTTECAHCGESFDWEPAGARNARRYCGGRCKARAAEKRKRDREKAALAKELVRRPCLTCGEPFQQVRRNNVYCSTRCAMVPVQAKVRARRRAEAAGRGPRPVRLCSREGCEGKHLARGLCSRHYRALRRSEGHNDGYYLRNGDDRERATYWGVPWEPIDRAAVFARDGWKCHLCGELVDRLALFPDPDSPSVDHVVPMSRGGGHLWSNVATSHLGCNVRKGAGRAERSAP